MYFCSIFYWSLCLRELNKYVSLKTARFECKKGRFAISWQIPFRFCHFSRPFYLYKIRLIWPGDNCLWTEFMQNCLRSYKSRFQWSLSPKELMRRRFAFLALKKMDKAKTVFIQRRRLQAHLGKKEENLIATNSLVSLLMSCSLKYFFRDKWRHMFFLGDGRSSATNMIRIR